MQRICSPSYSVTVRAEIENRIGKFSQIAGAISQAGGDMGAIDIVRVEKGKIVRDITVNARDEKHEKKIVDAVRSIEGVKVLRVMDRTFFVHQNIRQLFCGRIRISSPHADTTVGRNFRSSK